MSACPACGYCPHCGRSNNTPSYPCYPYYPYNQPYCGTSTLGQAVGVNTLGTGYAQQVGSGQSYGQSYGGLQGDLQMQCQGDQNLASYNQ
jgi:hypothetical protein